MKRIVAAVDGSEHSLTAVARAAELAAKDDAELVLVSVVAPQTVDLDPGLEAYARVEHLREPGPRLALAAADRMLSRGRAEAVAKGATRISVEACTGDPAEEIVRAATACKADLVVVGSRGLGRLSGLLLGSVAQKLVTHAPCAVLVTR